MSSPDVPAEFRNLFDLLPGYDPISTAGDCWFDARTAEFAIQFFPKRLRFIEGEKAGQPFNLEPWQQAVNACLFGWKRPDGTRRYREALIYVARKSGKTPWMAGIVNLVLLEDGEPGAQLYSAGADREQAALIYRHAAGMIARNPEMAQLVRLYRSYKSIEYSATASTYKALSSDADTKHGLGAHLVIVDELHAHPNGDLVDVLKTSTAARRQPLVIYITTADYARESVCNRTHDYAGKVRDGIISDPSFLPVIFEASIEDDWTDPKVWAKANPNMGVSVKLEYLARECERAKNEPTYENVFKRLHLNIKTRQDVKWLSLEKWHACGQEYDESSLLGRTCFGGLDVSTKLDLSAWVLLFPPTEADSLWRVLPRFYAPAENAEKRERTDRVPYVTWAQNGFMTLTEGNVVDYAFIEAQILADARRFDLREIAFDPWNASSTATRLGEQGATMVEFSQGFRSMAEPTKELERLIVAGEIAHPAHPVLDWMASHVAVELDPAGNPRPSKRKSTERIDGIVALIMALGRAIVAEPAPTYDILIL